MSIIANELKSIVPIRQRFLDGLDSEMRAAYDKGGTFKAIADAAIDLLIDELSKSGSFKDKVMRRPCGMCGGRAQHGDGPGMMVCVRCVPSKESYEDLMGVEAVKLEGLDLYTAMASGKPFQNIKTANPHEWLICDESGYLIRIGAEANQATPHDGLAPLHYAMLKDRYRVKSPAIPKD